MTLFEWIAVIVFALILFAMWRVDATLTSIDGALRDHLFKMEADLATVKTEVEVISSIAGQYDKPPVVREI